MKRIFYYLVITLILTISFNYDAVAQSFKEIFMNCEVVPGEGIVVYAPPDFTTPTIGWNLEDMERGMCYEITYKVSNTANVTTVRECTIGEDVSDWVTVRFRPETFTLLPAASTYVNVSLCITPDSPIAWHGLPIRFVEVP